MIKYKRGVYMKTKEFVNILENIEELIEKENYSAAIDYIKKEKVEVLVEKDVVNEYLDDLVKELK